MSDPVTTTAAGGALQVQRVDKPHVEDGYLYVARLVGDENVSDDGMSRSVTTINVFTCLRCAALVADQGAHDRWHDPKAGHGDE